MPPAAAAPVIITPDGSTDLQWIDGCFRIAGPDAEPVTEAIGAGATVIGFRFRPGAAASWLGTDLTNLVGQRLPLENIWSRNILRGISQDLCESSPRPGTELPSLIAAIARTVACWRRDGAVIDDAMAAAYRFIAEGTPSGKPVVPWLCRILGMSERTLRRRFDQSFGYGPKTLDRILRHQRFLRLASASTGSAAMLASEAGYADQAHLVRESRRLTGLTPAALQRLRAEAAV